MRARKMIANPVVVWAAVYNNEPDIPTMREWRDACAAACHTRYIIEPDRYAQFEIRELPRKRK